MAEIINNDKGFKVIKMTSSECVNTFQGSVGICDFCNGSDQKGFDGYYIAVLNRWYCESDYQAWYERSINYPQDQAIETKNFENTKALLNL